MQRFVDLQRPTLLTPKDWEQRSPIENAPSLDNLHLWTNCLSWGETRVTLLSFPALLSLFPTSLQAGFAGANFPETSPAFLGSASPYLSKRFPSTPPRVSTLLSPPRGPSRVAAGVRATSHRWTAFALPSPRFPRMTKSAALLSRSEPWQSTVASALVLAQPTSRPASARLPRLAGDLRHPGTVT